MKPVHLIYPAISVTTIFLVWEICVRFLDIPPYVLPSPGEVANSLWVGLVKEGSLYPHILATLQSTVFGYLVGCGSAIILGIVLSEAPLLERFLHPVIVAIQSIPKVALAPLLIVWFGYGLSSKVATVALICFFPVFVNTLSGIRSTNPDLISLYKVFSASRWSIQRNVKIPSAAGAIFAGLQISVVMALIGAVIAEFLSSQRGLGNVIQASQVTLDVANIFGAILILAMIGVLSSGLITLLERRIVFWERKPTQDRGV